MSRRGWREAGSQGVATAFIITATAAGAVPIATHAATAFAITATAAGAASCAAMPTMLPIVLAAMRSLSAAAMPKLKNLIDATLPVR